MERKFVDRRKEDRRKDIESARNYIGMERRLGERRRAYYPLRSYSPSSAAKDLANTK